jgi:hypothetical protein
MLRHASTEGMVYRHHQARQLALVADGQHTLWALAADGSQWDSMVATDPLLAGAVKGYVRHDLYLQEIFADFREQLEAAYGPGLDKLVTPYAGAHDQRPAAPAPAAVARKGKATTKRKRSA